MSPVVLLLAVCRGVHPGGTDVELNWMFAKRNQDVSCYGDVLVCLSNRLSHMSDSNWCFSPAAIAQLDMFISRYVGLEQEPCVAHGYMSLHPP